MHLYDEIPEFASLGRLSVPVGAPAREYTPAKPPTETWPVEGLPGVRVSWTRTDASVWGLAVAVDLGAGTAQVHRLEDLNRIADREGAGSWSARILRAVEGGR